MSSTSKRVAAYIRVSTDEQAEKGDSLDEQKERLAAYCVVMGWQPPIFFVDDGYSAKNLKRPELQRALSDIKLKTYDMLITTKLDRLCRNLKDLLTVIDTLDEYGCGYVSASEFFDTSTTVGRMTLQLLGTFAEFERGRISDNVKATMSSIARRTDRALARPCYGYDVIDGKYTINQQEASIVRLMFAFAETGHEDSSATPGHRAIAKMLNDKGHRTRQGKEWDQVNVKRLMTNKMLIGVVTYNERDTKGDKVKFREESEWIIKVDNHEPIIDAHQFDRVQNIFASRSIAGKHADNETYLLTGVIRCGFCGDTMKGNTTRYKKYAYYKYICSSYARGYGCKYHAIHREALETFVKDTLRGLPAKFAHDFVAVAPIVQKVKSKDETKELKDRLARIDARMQKQIDAWTDGLIKDGDLQRATERAEAERAEIESKLANVAETVDIAEIQKRIEDRMIVIDGEDRLAAKAALRDILALVEVKDDLVNIQVKP